MLHTKFRDNRPAGSGAEYFQMVFTIYGRGGNLGHVTSISLYLKAFVKNLIQFGKEVSEKIQFEFF